MGIPDGKSKGVISLPAKPQGFVVEQHGNRIFANLPSLKQIAVLDREKQTLLATWSLNGASGNYPIALDEEKHRLIVGCRQPAQLVVFNTDTGKSVTSVASCGDTDDLTWDAAHKSIYIACGDGSIDVISQEDADHCRLRERIPARVGARNSCFSPDLNEFYLAVPQRDGKDGEIRIYQPK